MKSWLVKLTFCFWNKVTHSTIPTYHYWLLVMSKQRECIVKARIYSGLYFRSHQYNKQICDWGQLAKPIDKELPFYWVWPMTKLGYILIVSKLEIRQGRKTGLSMLGFPEWSIWASVNGQGQREMWTKCWMINYYVRCSDLASDKLIHVAEVDVIIVPKK